MTRKENGMKRSRKDYEAVLIGFLEAVLDSKRIRNRRRVLICVPCLVSCEVRRKPAMRATRKAVKMPVRKIRGGSAKKGRE